MEVFRELGSMLAAITGFSAVSLQPNSGAQGEFAGLMVIRAFHRDSGDRGNRGETARDVVLIPASAHGTNPASAVMAAIRVVAGAPTPGAHIHAQDVVRKTREKQSHRTPHI